ncbi:hypothetical protein [Knoellia koreensis]|uniref:Uncharacterized protein n=1 Tax=Knoellia koreensis TaxID=2730921 RepID=A0A849HL55_9MICO|nr:hypothetical protein [Knoellia sp. DB2414S]NNM48052.1 hypothetical protein [Knoellia sp. DB2414S]
MSTPPTPPTPPGRGDPEHDPTGMRDLLASLPDPGPMPEDLVQRITASLAAEQAARAGDPHRDADGSGATVVPLDSRRRWNWRHVAAAAAAVAVIGVGVPAALSGGNGGLIASLSGGSSDGSAASSGAQSQGLAATGAPSGPPEGGLSPSVTPTLPPATPSTADSKGLEQANGTAYTTAGLARQVTAALQAKDAKGSGADQSASSVRGPADTDQGLRDCLLALGVGADTVVWVDRGTLDGAPAVVAVVEAPGGRTAYAVAPGCDAGHAVALAGPLPVG